MSESNLPQFQGRVQLRPRYEETDQGGIIHHSRYVVWFETARTEWLRDQGLPYKAMEERGIRLLVSEGFRPIRIVASIRQLSFRSLVAFCPKLLGDCAEGLPFRHRDRPSFLGLKSSFLFLPCCFFNVHHVFIVNDMIDSF